MTKTLTNTLPEALRDAIPQDIDPADVEITTYADLAATHRVDSRYIIPDDAIVAILPGWYADDGSARVYYPLSDGAGDAAQEYVDDGEWGDDTKTSWITVYAWRTGYALDKDGDPAEITIDRDRHTTAHDPKEPDCEDGEEHDWRSPYSLLGGCKENPGVWGHGGGVVITEVCAHCGCYRVTDTWAQDPATGAQGLKSVAYRDADEASAAWLDRRLRARAGDDASMRP